MRRFYIEPAAINGDRGVLDKEESHHLVRVLRLQRGEAVEIFDGTGTLYTGRIEQLGRQVTVILESKMQPQDKEQGGSVIVCQGELKGGKMDFLVEKCTELGVERFIPFSAGRSQGRLDGARLRQRRQRRLSIVKKACKQSGRLRLMWVDQDMGFDEMLNIEFEPSYRKIILWEREEALRLGDVIGGDRDNPVCLMIGPEGGFSETEAEEAHLRGWHHVSLGDQILRAETAAISAVAVTNHLLGRT